MATQTTNTPIVTMSLGMELPAGVTRTAGSKDFIEIGEQLFVEFKWKSLINDGYVVHCTVTDPYLSILRDLVRKKYLSRGRKGIPLIMKFRIGWGDSSLETPDRIAYVSDLRVTGNVNSASLNFVAIDPPSWRLNAGTGDGKVYKGRISNGSVDPKRPSSGNSKLGVIQQVIKEFAPEISLQATVTSDSDEGRWSMMRQDPKTFIKSLLDWSSSLTPKRTHWLIASVDRKLIIKEQFGFIAGAGQLAIFNATDDGNKNDLIEFELLSNSSLTLLQTKMITQGLSTVSGKFIDKQTSRGLAGLAGAEVNDNNTGNKINSLKKDDTIHGFSKPEGEFATSIMAIPEFSDGSLGLRYEDYIDGRARQLYLSMLPMVMRMKIQVPGDHRFHDSSRIGVANIELLWKDIEEEDFFLGGTWLVYGWTHYIDRSDWVTDIYLYRIDHDAKAFQARKKAENING